jgi:hypothetical protein
MNRTTATSIAGIRSKATSKIGIHFFHRPREAERFTRRFFAFDAGMFAKRPLRRTECNWLCMTRPDFRKRPECATLIARERYTVTEKLLLNASGWQTMKPAREVLKSDRKAKYEAPLLSGYLRRRENSHYFGDAAELLADPNEGSGIWAKN